MPETIDSTAEEITAADSAPQTGALAVTQRQHSTQLLAGSPTERVEAATEMATALDQVIKKQGMRTKVGRTKVVQENGSEQWVDKYHVNVEAWQTLATFLGLAVVPVWSRRVIDPSTGQPQRVTYTVHEKTWHKKGDGGGLKAERTFEIDGYSWESRVECYKDGALMGAGEGMCSRTEGTWKERDDYALRGMAQTRATSRAIAGAARWIVTLAGYSATPAEEMPDVADAPAAPELPAWALPASDKLIGTVDRALAFLLGVEPDDPAVRPLRAKLQAEYGSDVIPQIAAQAAVHIAAAVREAGGSSATGMVDGESPSPEGHPHETPVADEPPAEQQELA